MALIAIDGPGGSGKSTVARLLAERLGLERLDTGAMYRALALLALRRGVEAADEAALADLAAEMTLEVGERVLLEGGDVTDEIRSGEVEAVVSTVAAHPKVRAELVSRQRAWVARRGEGVVEGRDIGTVVAPGADVKIYLTARPEVRASRRAGEERPGQTGDVEGARAAIERRDAIDSSRAASPLEIAPGAHVIDSSDRSAGEIVEEVLALL